MARSSGGWGFVSSTTVEARKASLLPHRCDREVHMWSRRVDRAPVRSASSRVSRRAFLAFAAVPVGVGLLAACAPAAPQAPAATQAPLAVQPTQVPIQTPAPAPKPTEAPAAAKPTEAAKPAATTAPAAATRAEPKGKLNYV